VRGVDDQVQDGEAQVAGVTRHLGHLAELDDRVGVVLVLVAGELERAAHLLVDVDRHQALAIAQVGVRAHALHDLRDPCKPGARVGDRLRCLGQHLGEPELVGAGARVGDRQLAAREAGEASALFLQRGREHRHDIGEVLEARRGELGRRVDLVRDAGGKLAERLEAARPALLVLVTHALAHPRLDLALHLDLEVAQLVVEHAPALPLLGEAGGELAHLDRVERLAQHDEPVAGDEAARDVLPRVVAVGAAQHDLELGLALPHALDRLDAVDAGRHADVDERERERPVLAARLRDGAHRVLALERERELVRDGRRLRR
jgi:hypothetical protein